jgi:hypothetical protein
MRGKKYIFNEKDGKLGKKITQILPKKKDYITFEEVEEFYDALMEDGDIDYKNVSIVAMGPNNLRTLKSFNQAYLDYGEDYFRDKTKNTDKYKRYSFVEFIRK